jgi:starch synthase (maltosyl-transferring)
LIAYSKLSPDGRTRILTIVSLNPHESREGMVCLALADAPIADQAAYAVRDLLTDRTYLWTGPWNYVRLDPELPAHVLHLSA